MPFWWIWFVDAFPIAPAFQGGPLYACNVIVQSLICDTWYHCSWIFKLSCWTYHALVTGKGILGSGLLPTIKVNPALVNGMNPDVAALMEHHGGFHSKKVNHGSRRPDFKSMLLGHMWEHMQNTPTIKHLCCNFISVFAILYLWVMQLFQSK